MLLKEDDSFLLEIRSNPSVEEESVTNTIHRKIIELFKSQDSFRYVDLHIQTSRGLSATARVDLCNALAHMRNKCNKKLRKLKADMDYMDPTVHEFVLLQCLSFQHICLTSNPEFEQTPLSAGLAMSLQHAMTMNRNGCGTNVLDLTCAISEPVSELLTEAMRQSCELKTLKLHLLGPTNDSSPWIGRTLAPLCGKSTLEILHLRDINASVCTDLANLLGDAMCRVKELSLSYDWAMEPKYNTQQLCQALTDMTNNNKNNKSSSCRSVTTLLLDGIQFDPVVTNVAEQEVASSWPLPWGSSPSPLSSSLVSSSSASSSSSSKPPLPTSSSPPPSATTRVLPLAFPNMETLSLASPQMPRLDAFLDLPHNDLPQQLKHCYFPCSGVLDIDEGRSLVETLPNIVDVPDFASDPYVECVLNWRKISAKDDALLSRTAAALLPPHLLDWRKKVILGGGGSAAVLSLLVSILEQTNITLKDEHPRRQANMAYTILQDYYRLQKKNTFTECHSIYDNKKDKDDEVVTACSSTGEGSDEGAFEENLFAAAAGDDDGDY